MGLVPNATMPRGEITRGPMVDAASVAGGARVQALLAKGPSPNAVGRSGTTALYAASLREDPETAESGSSVSTTSIPLWGRKDDVVLRRLEVAMVLKGPSARQNALSVGQMQGGVGRPVRDPAGSCSERCEISSAGVRPAEDALRSPLAVLRRRGVRS